MFKMGIKLKHDFYLKSTRVAEFRIECLRSSSNRIGCDADLADFMTSQTWHQISWVELLFFKLKLIISDKL
jgi:hypothetical protein